MKSTKLVLADVFTVDFNSSEASNVDACLKRAGLKLQKNQCVLLFSMSGRIVYFVRAPIPGVDMGTGAEKQTLYASMKLRLKGAGKVSWWDDLPEFFTWCETCGIDVTGLRAKVYEFAEKNGKADARKLAAVG